MSATAANIARLGDASRDRKCKKSNDGKRRAAPKLRHRNLLMSPKAYYVGGTISRSMSNGFDFDQLFHKNTAVRPPRPPNKSAK
jgi:hypothetical protein